MVIINPTGEIAIATLEAFQDCAIEFAVLHDEANLANGDVSTDVDIVVDRSVAEVLAATRSRLRSAQIHPIMVYPYDPGGSAAVFMCDPSGSRGFHLDMFFDPQGVGRFGIRTNHLLEDRRPGVRWPTASEQHAAAYLLRKRHWKADPDRLKVHLLELSEANFDPNAGLFVSQVGRAVARLLEGKPPGRFVVPHLHHPHNAVRLIRRVVRPVGFWIHTVRSNSEMADKLAHRFGTFVVTAKSGRAPTGDARSRHWYPRHVLPVRLAAGVYVSWSMDSIGVRPDLVIDNVDGLEAAAKVAVAAMERRFLR